MRSIVIFRFFSHLSLLFVYQCITFLPLIFRFSFYIPVKQSLDSLSAKTLLTLDLKYYEKNSLQI